MPAIVRSAGYRPAAPTALVTLTAESGVITPDATEGAVFRHTATADVELGDPINGKDGQQIQVQVIASGGTRTLTLSGNPVKIPSGSRWIATLSCIAPSTWAVLNESIVAPPTVPSAPTIGTATRGNGQVQVAFTASFDNGGSPITSYVATASPGGATGAGTTSPIAVTGLTNGTSYTFTVRAVNAIGQSTASAVSNTVVPSTVPGAPTIGAATLGAAGTGQASVTFTAPASNGGATITSYVVTASTGQTASGSGSPITVSGLEPGTAVTFTVRAVNVAGQSAASAASNSVTPDAETFTGANSAVWPSPWVRTTNGGTIDIQSNAGRMLTSAVGSFPTCYASRPGPANGEAMFYFNFASVAGERYLYAFLRSTSGTTQANGYALCMKPQVSQIVLVRSDAAADVAIPGTSPVSFTFTAATDYRVRLRWQGSTIQARVWGASGAEPGTWTITATDTTYGVGGSFMFGMRGGTDGVGRSCTLDNFSLIDLGA